MKTIIVIIIFAVLAVAVIAWARFDQGINDNPGHIGTCHNTEPENPDDEDHEDTFEK